MTFFDLKTDYPRTAKKAALTTRDSALPLSLRRDDRFRLRPLRPVPIRPEPPLALPLAHPVLHALRYRALRVVALLHGNFRGVPPAHVRVLRVLASHVRERLPHEEVVPMYQGEAGVLVPDVDGVRVVDPDGLRLLDQPVDFVDEGVDVLQQRRGRGGVVLLVEGELRLGVARPVSPHQGLLVVDVGRAEVLIEKYIPHLVGDLPRPVEEHPIVRVPQVRHVLVHRLGQQLAVRRGTLLVQEAVPREQVRRVARIRVPDPQRGPRLDVVGGVRVVIPGVVVRGLDLDVVGRRVVEVIGHGDDPQVAVLGLDAAGVRDLVGPLHEVLSVILDPVAQERDVLDRLLRQADLVLALLVRQPPHQGGEALQAEVRHGRRVGEVPGKRVQPREPGAVPPLLDLLQYLEHEVPVPVLRFGAVPLHDQLGVLHLRAPQLGDGLAAREN
mmetsp:Transcript_200/g.462  ORF Transcript_200/g.462 Transcript_200/m.462 type:complete len:441 (-) Transcript_200:464-1786(-)